MRRKNFISKIDPWINIKNYNFNLANELHILFDNIKWEDLELVKPYKNIDNSSKNYHTRMIAYIIECEVCDIIKSWSIQNKITYYPSKHNQYPDSGALTKGPLKNKFIAIDVKTAKLDIKKQTRFTLINSNYFLNPDKLCAANVPYNKFDEHWTIGFLYEYHLDKSVHNKISIIDVIISETWKIASKNSGSGNTKYIASIDLSSIGRNKKGDFSSEKNMMDYWKNFILYQEEKKEEKKKLDSINKTSMEKILCN